METNRKALIALVTVDILVRLAELGIVAFGVYKALVWIGAI